MGRRPLIRTSLLAYHITSRCNNREWFELPLREVWKIFCNHLCLISERYETEIHTFCLMANHFHLLMTTPLGNLDDAMRDLMTGTSKAVARATDRINHTFGARYKWSLLSDCRSMGLAHKYVARNPVRAGICKRVEDYPFSTIYWESRGDNPIPLVSRTDMLWAHLRQPRNEHLAWLNSPTKRELEELIRKALRRREFQFSNGNEVRKLVEVVYRDYLGESRRQ